MKTDYDMLFEHIILAAWGKTWKATDPFKLGSADVINAAGNELSGENGHDAKFALSTALRKVAADHNSNDESEELLLELDRRTWVAQTYNDICQVLVETKEVFNKLGIEVL